MKSLCLILVFYLYFVPISAQGYQYHVRSISMEDGLSSSSLVCFYEDSKGVIWLGTSNGINRYDGMNIWSYTKKSHGLCHDYIQDISEDEDGMIWVASGDFHGSSNCISIIDPWSDEVFTLEDYVNSQHLNHFKTFRLSAPANGISLMSTSTDSTVLFWELSKTLGDPYIVRKENNPSFSLNHTCSFAIDSLTYLSVLSGSLDKGADKKRFSTTINGLYRDRYMDESVGLSDLAMSVGGQLYLARVSKDDPKRIDIFEGAKQLGSVNFRKDDANLIFNSKRAYVTGKEGIWLYDFTQDQTSKIYFQYNSNIRPDRVDVFLDSQGNLWYQKGSEIYTLNFTKKLFKTYMDDQSVTGFATPMRGIQMIDDTLYISHFFGTHKIGPDGNIVPHPNPELMKEGKMGLLYHNQVYYSASERDGIFVLDNNKLSVLRPRFPDEKIPLYWQTFPMQEGSIWAGSEAGLSILDMEENTIRKFEAPSPYADINQSSVYHAHSKGDTAFFCTSSGLYEYSKTENQLTNKYGSLSKEENFMPALNITHISPHHKLTNTYWITSKDNGLIMWNKNSGTYKNYNSTNSNLSNNTIYAVYQDYNGNLWLPTSNGLNYFDPKTESFTIYTTEDGLPSNEFNTISHYADGLGNIYFGTINGLIAFHPDSISHEKPNPGNLIISEVTLINPTDGDTVLVTADFIESTRLKVSPKFKAINMHVGLTKIKTSDNRTIQYRLLPLSDQWLELKDGQITFSNLPYEDYNLELRTISLSGSNPEYYSNKLKLNLAAPFYLTVHGITLIGMLLISIITAIIKYREIALKKRQKELEQIIVTRTAKIQEQADEIKSIDERKTQYFSNISHELRTPLTLISGPVSYMLDNVTELSTTEIQSNLETVYKNSSNLLNLTNEILTLTSSLEKAERINLQWTPIYFFMHNLFRNFEPKFKTQNIKASFKFECEKSLFLKIDRPKIQKVVHNYLSNAIKFCKGEIEMSVVYESSNLIIQVSDNGPGIQPSMKENIFKRFYQIMDEDFPTSGGTGIGLALVHQIAQSFGGKAYVESTPNVITTFVFDIPQVESREDIDEGQDDEVLEQLGSAVDMPKGSKKILLVEDNLDMAQFIMKLLPNSYDVHHVGNGALGLNVLEKQPIDLVISDVMMPVMDGISFLSEVKKDEHLSKIPFIILTAKTDERTKLGAFRIGVDDYLTKPFLPSELLIRIANLLTNSEERKKFAEEEGQSSDLSPSDTTMLRSITDYIRDNISEQTIDVDVLAKSQNLSPRQLTRKTKLLTGLTPGKYIREVQLQMAIEILESGDALSVAEVAYQIGFDYSSTFSNLFKKRFSRPPSDYLRK